MRAFAPQFLRSHGDHVPPHSRNNRRARRHGPSLRWVGLLAATVAVLLLAVAPPAFAGKLDRVRAAAKGSHTKSSSRSSSDSSYGNGGSAEDVVLALYIVASPWWLPHAALGDQWGRPFAYLSHPYADGHSGYVLQAGRDAPGHDASGRAVLGAGTSVRASVEGGLIDPTMTRFGLAGRISGSSRFEVETRWDLFSEALPGGAIDQLWLGDVTVTWQHAVGRHGQFRSGLGVRALVDRGETTYGINFTYGMDLYPVRPLVLHAAVDLGTVGQAVVTQVQASFGLMLGPLELYAGYDQTWIDDIDLGGPTVGLRMWR